MRRSRARHNLGHYRLLTGDMGQILPIGCVEVLPNDVIRHNASAMIRMTPLIAPVYHPSDVRIHHFFVPNRIVWDGWEDFITGGSDGNDASSPPTISTTGTANDLLDYFGIPLVSGIDINAMPIRAFNAIFNYYYRDQDLVTERTTDQLDVPNCAWQKDYFTTARPWTQKGTDVVLPLGTEAPVRGLGFVGSAFPGSNGTVQESGQSPANTTFTNYEGTTSSELLVQEDPNASGYPRIYADLADATGATVPTVRRVFALQRIAEARARYGSRHSEYLRYAFDAQPADSRLQNPEYLGGGRVRVSVSEVLQTAPETDQTDATDYGVGDMYGHAIASLRSNTYQRKFQEHGYIISLLSVRPKTLYLDGIPRHWLRQDRDEYFQPELAHVGQQAIKNNEVFAVSTASGDETFGYQDQYREYREQPSQVAGEFRSTLNYWHQGRDFASAPALNSTFVECDPTKRIFTEQSAHSMWIMVNHSITANRVVPRNAEGFIR